MDWPTWKENECAALDITEAELDRLLEIGRRASMVTGGILDYQDLRQVVLRFDPSIQDIRLDLSMDHPALDPELIGGIR